MRQKLRIDGHHVFEVTVHRTIFDHPDFAVALDDLCFDLADFLVDENADVFLAADDSFACFDDAVGTEGISRAWPGRVRHTKARKLSAMSVPREYEPLSSIIYPLSLHARLKAAAPAVSSC